MVYTEKDLIIPTLEFLKDNPEGKTTTQISKYLRNRLNPNGDDLTILSGRQDDKFSQKVRNLKAHDTLSLFAYYIKDKGKISGYFKINEKGLKFLEDNSLLYDNLSSQGFSDIILKKEVRNNFKNIIIEEGNLTIKNVKVKERSRLLRNLKIKDFKEKNNGKIFCEICLFNFMDYYGPIGKDLIVIHHTKPIHLKSDVGEKKEIRKALKDLACVCPNCHHIIHKDRNKMLSLQEVKILIKRNQ